MNRIYIKPQRTQRVKLKKVIVPVVVFIVYALLISFVYSRGSHFLSDGWNRIDNSEYRDFLYNVYYKILPLLCIIGTSHFLYSVVGKGIFIKAFVVALFLGLLGPVFLHVSISSSSDPMAVMGYLASVLFYSICFILFLTILTIVLLGINIYKKPCKSRQSCQE